MEGFDPKNNAQDRRMLFEVTGMRLFRDEFQQEDSSDSDEEFNFEELLPSDYAMMDRFNEDDDDDPDNAT